MTVNANQYYAQMITQMALVQGSISTVGNLQEATPVVLKTVYQAVQNALVPFNNVINAFDTDIDVTTFGGILAGLPAPTLALNLINQALDCEQLSMSIIARAYVTRAGVNIGNAPG